MPQLPPQQIKEAIGHEQKLVRIQALRYFAESYSTDPEVLPRAIEAIETYGDNAFGFAGVLLRDLAQTDRTLTWCVEQLREPTSADDERNHHISGLIASADVNLLIRHRARILAAPGLPRDDRTEIEQRIRLTTEPLDRLWNDLEAFCEGKKDTRYATDMDLPHAFRLTEAIARHTSCADRVLGLVAVDAADDDAVACMRETLACRIAGLMRLEAAVPHLARKLHIDADWDREQWCEALARIGTDAAVEAIARNFSEASWDCRLYASGVLEDLRCPTVVGRSLELAEREDDADIYCNLVIAALANFATEGIEPALALVRDGIREPLHPLLAVSLLAGADFPERERWVADQARRGQPGGIATFLDDKLMPVDPFELDDANDELLPPPVPQIVTRANRTGRNEPCPCGSGRKYKKCCLAVEHHA